MVNALHLSGSYIFYPTFSFMYQCLCFACDCIMLLKLVLLKGVNPYYVQAVSRITSENMKHFQ